MWSCCFLHKKLLPAPFLASGLANPECNITFYYTAPLTLRIEDWPILKVKKTFRNCAESNIWGAECGTRFDTHGYSGCIQLSSARGRGKRRWMKKLVKVESLAVSRNMVESLAVPTFNLDFYQRCISPLLRLIPGANAWTNFFAFFFLQMLFYCSTFHFTSA